MYIFDENDIYFRSPAGAFQTPGTLKLRLKLLRDSAVGARACLYIDGGEVTETVMEFAHASGAYDSLKCKLAIDAPGLYWYYFLIDKSDGTTVVVPENAGDAFQLTAYAPAAVVPDWIHGGFIYHIFVDRFRQGGPLLLRPGATYRPDWGGCPHYIPDEEGIVRNDDFFGGNLYGVIEKLPYLEGLGVTCIYLSPVFDAASNHKYDTGDFERIDPAFGGDEAFEELCSEAGARGIKIILDGVFNHVGIDSRYFNKYGTYDSIGAWQDKSSPYSDWFTFREDGTYESWWGIELLPATNKRSTSYRDFICSKEGVVARWTRAGVAGWRLDVVDELPDVFLYPLCKAIKRENGSALIIGEVWEDASNKIAYDVRRRYFLGGQLDSTTNYPLKDAIIAFVKYGKSENLANTMSVLCRNYPAKVLHSLMNILGTHDTVRILTALSGEELPGTRAAMEIFALREAERGAAVRRLKIAALLQFTLPGVPCVFYGDEAGMEGCADPFNRRCYPWGHEDTSLLAWYTKLSQIRKSFDCFKNGAYTLVEARAGLFAFIRGSDPEHVLIAVNASNSDRTLSAEAIHYALTAGMDPGGADVPFTDVPGAQGATEYFDVLKNEYTDKLTIMAGEPGIFTQMKGTLSDGFTG